MDLDEKTLIKWHEQRQKQYDRQNEYNKTNYDRINLTIPKGYKDILKDKANSLDMSVNAYILNIIDKDINGTN